MAGEILASCVVQMCRVSRLSRSGVPEVPSVLLMTCSPAASTTANCMSVRAPARGAPSLTMRVRSSTRRVSSTCGAGAATGSCSAATARSRLAWARLDPRLTGGQVPFTRGVPPASGAALGSASRSASHRRARSRRRETDASASSSARSRGIDHSQGNEGGSCSWSRVDRCISLLMSGSFARGFMPRSACGSENNTAQRLIDGAVDRDIRQSFRVPNSALFLARVDACCRRLDAELTGHVDRGGQHSPGPGRSLQL